MCIIIIYINEEDFILNKTVRNSTKVLLALGTAAAAVPQTSLYIHAEGETASLQASVDSTKAALEAAKNTVVEAQKGLEAAQNAYDTADSELKTAEAELKDAEDA